MGTVTMAFTGQSENLYIQAGIFSLDNLHLTGKALCWSGTGWLTLGISCQKGEKQCTLGFWLEILILHGCPLTVSICPSG